jgi:hypothetical protein
MKAKDVMTVNVATVSSEVADVMTLGLVVVEEETPLARRFPMRSMPVLALLAAALAISGCQQVPSGHWSGKPCSPRAVDAGNCYGTALPPPPL